MKILMVLTSHDRLGDTGKKTGFWLEELAAPYYVFKDAGAQITLASPKGGRPPVDPKSDAPDAQTEATERFLDDKQANAALANTVQLSDIDARDYDAVFYPGGHGPLWDLTENPKAIALLEAFDLADKPIALVCHGPGVLRHARGANGQSLIKGRKVTGFSNSEETAVGLSGVVPFLIEDEFKKIGAIYQKGNNWTSYVVVDGKLITGQNPASSTDTAKALLRVLRN